MRVCLILISASPAWTLWHLFGQPVVKPCAFLCGPFGPCVQMATRCAFAHAKANSALYNLFVFASCPGRRLGAEAEDNAWRLARATLAIQRSCSASDREDTKWRT
jgi:hypothetical protein